MKRRPPILASASIGVLQCLVYSIMTGLINVEI